MATLTFAGRDRYTTLRGTTPVNTVLITNRVMCVTQLSVLKHVTDGIADANNWQVTATPTIGAAFSAVGNEAVVTDNTFSVTPGEGFALSEEFAGGTGSNIAYIFDHVEKCEASTAAEGFDSSTCVAIDDFSAISVAIGEHDVYRIVNKPAPMVQVPFTGGMSAELFGYAGFGLLGAALILGMLYSRRSIRRQTEVQ